MNPMNEAWTLLKGNPAMRDRHGQAINHPAAMVYENLASRLEDERRPHTARRRRAEGLAARSVLNHGPREELSDLAEEMRKPTHQMRIRRNLERGGNPTFFDLRIAQQRDDEDKKRLNAMRQDARDETSHEMAQGNRFPEVRNYGVERQQM
jgi:uncharacterized membrane-anchored protein YjiN (DUF445 family)